MTALLGVAGVPTPELRDFFCSGVAYGGGALDLAASQSKGTDEDMEGVDAGER